MSYRLIITEDALGHILNAYSYYEEKGVGLGEKFSLALQDRFDNISANPQHYSFVDERKKLRDVKLKGFPYVVVFDVIEGDVTIYFVHNTYQKTRF